MESSYGIGVKNRYAIFIGEEEEDPMTIIDHKVSERKEEKTRTLSNSNKNVKALSDSKHTSTTIRDTNTSQKDSNIISIYYSFFIHFYFIFFVFFVFLRIYCIIDQLFICFCVLKSLKLVMVCSP
jgi:hypothetical protein